MDSRRKPGPFEHYLHRRGGRNHDIRATNGFLSRLDRLHFHADLRAHLAAELSAPLRISPKRAHSLETAHGRDSFELSPRLIARADNPREARIRVRQIFCRDPRGRAGSDLAQGVGFDQRRHFAGRRSK